jgi:putative transposase
MGARKNWNEEQIIVILKQVEAGRTVAQVCRENGVGESTYYKWKSKYGGLEVNEARRLKALEDENSRLKRLLMWVPFGRRLIRTRRACFLFFIEPGKPVQNAHIESFNGKLRNECLNREWFTSLREAQEVIEQWRQEYNQVHPHSSLNNLPPEVWRQKQAQTFTPDWE